jgi:hypothetical protein
MSLKIEGSPKPTLSMQKNQPLALDKRVAGSAYKIAPLSASLKDDESQLDIDFVEEWRTFKFQLHLAIPDLRDERMKAIDDLNAVFNRSIRYPRSLLSGNFRSDLFIDETQPAFDRECRRFIGVLVNQALGVNNADIIYICIGHGGVAEQVWPGFVLNGLQEGKKVHLILLEDRHNYPRCRQIEERQVPCLASDDVARQYVNYPLKNGLLYSGLHNLSVDQFLCGIPSHQTKAFDKMPIEERLRYQKGGDKYGAICWQKDEWIQNVRRMLPFFVKKMLEQGKHVILGDHSGPLRMQDLLVITYNDLRKIYPDHLRFLWGYAGFNRMTKKEPITREDIGIGNGFNIPPATKIWRYYAKDKGGLNQCELF